MPRYNLNHQDIDSIVEGLNRLIKECHNTQDFNRINNLKSRLLFKLTSKKDSKDEGDR